MEMNRRDAYETKKRMDLEVASLFHMSSRCRQEMDSAGAELNHTWTPHARFRIACSREGVRRGAIAANASVEAPRNQ